MTMLNNRGSARTAIIVAVVTIAVIVLGVWALNSSSPATRGNPVDLPSPVTQDDWTKGAGSITLVEYSDFECPACASYFPLIDQVTQKFADSVSFTYRHFPLTSIHPNAEPAARAAEAAGVQGAFWEMHDLLFKNQRTWSNESNPAESFVFYAEQLGLNTVQFEQDYTSSQARDRVARDRTEAVNAGINATPTFFLNGEQIPNPRSAEEFNSLIQNAIEQNSSQQ